MAFRDLEEFLSVKPVELPIRGKVYAFPGEVSGHTWLTLQKLAHSMQQVQAAKESGEPLDEDAVILTDADEAAIMVELFAGVDEEMAADGCTSAQIKAVFYTLLAYHTAGEESAEAVWESQGEAPAPNRATRRSQTPTRSRGSRASSTDRAVQTASHGIPSSTIGT